MRAVVLRKGRLQVRETADPVPGAGHLLLRVVSTEICASDVHFMDHHDAVPEGGIGMVYDENRDIVLGHEFVGDVIGHGPGCSRQFPVGTRVTAMPVLLADGGIRVIGQNPAAQGSFGERMVVSEVMARAVPEGVSPDAVAPVDAFAVGEYYVRSSGIGPGEIPNVIGSGAIGLSAVAALAMAGSIAAMNRDGVRMCLAHLDRCADMSRDAALRQALVLPRLFGVEVSLEGKVDRVLARGCPARGR